MTTGTRNTAVTELIDTSEGANKDLAARSQAVVTNAPKRKQPGIMIEGLLLPVRFFIRCGTAIPTKDMGPAKAVTVAAKRPDIRIRLMRSKIILTPPPAA